jgi:hypothetical protein
MGGGRSVEGNVGVHGIDGVISEFTIANPQNVRAGMVDQAIAAAAGQSFALEQGHGSLLASRIAAQEVLNQPAGPAGNDPTQNGVQLTTGMYLQCLSGDAQGTLISAANTRMSRIRTNQTFQIASENFGAGKAISSMDCGFAEACSKSAENGSIFIMRGVNPDSLGEGGVLVNPGRYAPKPMTCHAKSSYFGFTKGLVPANPQFSRPDYVDTTGGKYQQALKDVQHTLGPDMIGTAEGVPLHLKGTIDQQECFVYQGTFQGIDDKTYRYQVAIPIKEHNNQQPIPCNSSTKMISDYIKKCPPKHIRVCQDPQPDDNPKSWKTPDKVSAHTQSHFGNKILMDDIGGPSFTAEPTLVIGLPAGTRGSQQTTERYYVSDYDVYAIAHTSGTAVGQNEQIAQWGNHGEFADPRDIKAIIAVNHQLLIKDQGQTIAAFEGSLGSRFRDFPIQHAAAAAGIVKTTETGLEGFAVPDFPLWVVEPGNVIKLDGRGDLAAYMIHLSMKEEKPAETILNSKVLDLCVRELVRGAA